MAPGFWTPATRRAFLQVVDTAGAFGQLSRAAVAVSRAMLNYVEGADWTAASAEAVVRAYAEEEGAKLGIVAQPLRAALTGRSTSPGIFDVLAVLGREESLGRIADQAR